MSEPPKHTQVTQATVNDTYEFLFAPWVKAMGLVDLQVGVGTASARLPQSADLQWASGAICGQALMSAIAKVLQSGSTITYLETHVTLAASGKLVAHATLEFV